MDNWSGILISVASELQELAWEIDAINHEQNGLYPPWFS